MPQISEPNRASSTQLDVHPLRIAQSGEAPKLNTAQEEEKPKPAGTIPPAELLFQNSVVCALILVLFAVAAKSKLQKIPKGFSNFSEFVAEQMSAFTTGIIGPGGEQYIPLIGTIFLYIFLMNLIGLIPSLHSPTSNITFTLAFGLFVWVYVQFVGVKNNGIVKYFLHFCGPIPLAAPLMLPIEIISDVFRPLTLAVRLFGNIFGEDVILTVLAGMGVASVATRWMPFHLPILLLALLTSLVQAMVFATLACIYISLVSHHDEEHHAEDHHADLLHDAVPHAAHSS